jgi:hypothetical protein
MSRQVIRNMKRAVSAGARADARSDQHALAKESALALLARSIRFRHRRLAVIRLATAVQAGSDIPSAYWEYCRQAAAESADRTLRDLIAEADRTAPAREELSAQ